MIGAGVAMLACCGGPALLAGGAVSGLGAALHSPWMIAVGVVLVLLGAGWITRVIRRRPAKPDGTDSAVLSRRTPSMRIPAAVKPAVRISVARPDQPRGRSTNSDNPRRDPQCLNTST